jgi:uncharacterized protein
MSYTDFRLLEVRTIGSDHKGIFAITWIPNGALLGFFDGRATVVDLAVDADLLNDFFWRQSVHLKRDGDRLLCYVPAEEPDGIDFLNHSCKPNAKVVDQLFVYAAREISPDEEIVADYRTFNLIAQGIPCWCEEAKCVI